MDTRLILPFGYVHYVDRLYVCDGSFNKNYISILH